MKLKLRSTIAAGIALAAAITLAACSGGASPSASGSGSGSKTPYVLGFNDALTGTIAFAGTTNLAGFQTYIDYVNDNGGVNGHPIELKQLDNRSDAATSIANYKQLVSEGAIGVFGNSASSAMIATAPLSESLKVPQMGYANADDFYTTYHPWVFKNGITLKQQVQLQGELITNTLYKGKSTKGLKVAIAQTSTASGPPFTEAVQALAKKNGWDVSTTQQVAVGATDCTTQAGLIVSSGAQIVLGNVTSVGEDVVCMRALLARGFTGKFVDQNSSVSEKTYQTLATDQWISLRLVNWWSDTTNPGTKAMQAQAKKAGTLSQLGDYSSDGYVAAVLAVKALESCGDKCTGTTLRDGLEKLKNVDTNGIAGPKTGFTTGDYGHTFPQARFFQWDAAKNQSQPIGDWLSSDR
jgi:branched-chain amino acid transport system substrate-binding protein